MSILFDQEMIEIKNILVGVDGSEEALRALKFASALSKSSGAELTIVYVTVLPSASNYGQVYVPF